MKTYIWAQLSEQEKQQVLQRPVRDEESSRVAKVQAIIEQVQTQGDAALRAFTQQYEGLALTQFVVTQEEFAQAQQAVSLESQAAIQFAYQQIKTYHAAFLPKTKGLATAPGVYCERQPRPIPRVGLYVPGGSAPLVSAVLMLGVPANLAHCPLKVLCTPANAAGAIDPHILVAAQMCEIDHVYKLGGAQAIAAMAYGTETIPKVDKIFGPGNAWVTTAKMAVAQDPLGAAIDMPAGPSELVVIADNAANPDWVAADLLSQAEHGPDSQVLLIALAEEFCHQVAQAISTQLAALSRREIAHQSLAHCRLIIAENMAQALAISNHYAPEHVILQVSNPAQYVSQIDNAGAVFLGPWTPETVGDYVTGSNHVLPTNGYARSYSGLSVVDFVKFINVQTVTEAGLRQIGPYAAQLAAIEGLTAHQQAVTRRLSEVAV